MTPPLLDNDGLFDQVQASKVFAPPACSATALLNEQIQAAEAALSEARRIRRCITRTSCSEFWHQRGRESALAIVVKTLHRQKRRSQNVPKVTHSENPEHS